MVLPYCTQPRQCHLTVIRIIWCSRAAQSLPSKPCSRERGLEPRVSDTDSLVTRQGIALETPETVPELQYRYFGFRSLAILFLPLSGWCLQRADTFLKKMIHCRYEFQEQIFRSYFVYFHLQGRFFFLTKSIQIRWRGQQIPSSTVRVWHLYGWHVLSRDYLETARRIFFFRPNFSSARSQKRNSNQKPYHTLYLSSTMFADPNYASFHLHPQKLLVVYLLVSYRLVGNINSECRMTRKAAGLWNFLLLFRCLPSFIPTFSEYFYSASYALCGPRSTLSVLQEICSA